MDVNIKEVMIGGRPITRGLADGADAYGSKAVEAGKIAKALIKRGAII